MAYKFCPFSFFSFYVNKESAQAGGAHHCVEESCALWDPRFSQCSLLSACQSIADGGLATSKRKVATPNVGSIVSRLRNKKLPTAPAVTPTAPTATPPATPPATTPPATPTATTPPATPTTATTATPPPATSTAATTPAAITPAPVAPTAVTDVTPVTVPEPAVATPAPVASETATTPVATETTKPSIEDLLTPPSVPASELPIISMPADDKKDEVNDGTKQ